MLQAVPAGRQDASWPQQQNVLRDRECTESMATSMMQRCFERLARVALVSNLAALHPFMVGSSAANPTTHPVQTIALLGGLVLALLGIFLFTGSLNWRNRFFPKVLAVLIFGLIIALTSALANVIQTEVVGVLSGSIWGLLIGGAAGGIVAGCGGASLQGMGRLSPPQLALLGAALIVTGFFIEFLVIGMAVGW